MIIRHRTIQDWWGTDQSADNSAICAANGACAYGVAASNTFGTAQDFDAMCRDIKFARSEGADGVVFGILNTDGHVDIERTRQLVELARPLSVTFHRAFDMSADLFHSLEDVCATGAERVLTSGGEQECLNGIDTVARLVKASRGRIKMKAGGRIGINNAHDHRAHRRH